MSEPEAIADALHRWSEEVADPGYFFGIGDTSDAVVFSMMQSTCADGARVIRELLAEIAALREGHLEGDAVAGAEEMRERCAQLLETHEISQVLDKFTLNGLVVENDQGHDLFISTVRASEMLRQRAAAIRALPAKTGGRHGE